MSMRHLTNGSALFDPPDHALLQRSVERAARDAAQALTDLAGRPVASEGVVLERVPVERLPYLTGDVERPVIAIYIGIAGAADGHLLLVLDERMARGLVNILLGEDESASGALTDLQWSALAEAGNIAGSMFLNALANRARLMLPPTPPLVVHEMGGAVLDTLAASLALAGLEETLVLETAFVCDGAVVQMSFYWLPSPALLAEVLGGLRKGKRHGIDRV